MTAAVACCLVAGTVAATSATAHAIEKGAPETGVRHYKKGGLSGKVKKYPEAKGIDLIRATAYRTGHELVFTLSARKVLPFATEEYDLFGPAVPNQQWCVEVYNDKMPEMRTFCAGHGLPADWWSADSKGGADGTDCSVGDDTWSATANPKTDKVRVVIPVSCFEGAATWRFSARSSYSPNFIGGEVVYDNEGLMMDWTPFADTSAH